jgi:hypothetical protein
MCYEPDRTLQCGTACVCVTCTLSCTKYKSLTSFMTLPVLSNVWPTAASDDNKPVTKVGSPSEGIHFNTVHSYKVTYRNVRVSINVPSHGDVRSTGS